MKPLITISVLFNDSDVRTFTFQTLRSVREFFRFNGRNIKTYTFYLYSSDGLSVRFYFDHTPVLRYRSVSQTYSVIREKFHIAQQLSVLPY